MSNISTPILDFVTKYANENNGRFHMPGHKGKDFIGIEKWDITEICGSDSLYEASGIIAESEKNLSEIFGSKASFYSTEGSSLCIRAMLYVALKTGKNNGKNKIVAARNVHKTFVFSQALLDFETVFVAGDESDLYTCKVSAKQIENELLSNPDTAAVYITSPDYLGNIADVKGISDICKKFNVPLIVDNAHGAYLKFITPSMHPMDLGADMCCDSAHKTLPSLTGGAYLHVSKKSKYGFEKLIKNAMALFASTSPSYIIMASLDGVNKTLCEGFAENVSMCAGMVENAKMRLIKANYGVSGNEPLKITLKTKQKGYYGYKIAEILQNNNVFCECFDRDNVVLMFSPYNSREDINKMCDILCSINTKDEICEDVPKICTAERKMTVRQAMMSFCETVAVDKAIGRVLASPSVSCPPAIPVAICGEVIDDNAVKCFKYYGIDSVDVVK